MRTTCWVTLLATTVSCSPVYENKYPYDVGWRRAVVSEVGEGAAIRSAAPVDCRAGRAPGAIEHRMFARVTYSQARNIRSMIVELADGANPQPGDKVYVKPPDCAAGMRPADG